MSAGAGMVVTRRGVHRSAADGGFDHSHTGTFPSPASRWRWLRRRDQGSGRVGPEHGVDGTVIYVKKNGVAGWPRCALEHDHVSDAGEVREPVAAAQCDQAW